MTRNADASISRVAAVAALFMGVLLPLWIFGALAEEVTDGELLPFDQPVLFWLHDHATPMLDRFMLGASQVGSALVLVPLALLVLARLLVLRRFGNAAYWALCTGGGALLNFAAKHGFARARPGLWLSLSPEDTYSFPSGHAMSTMAAFAALLVLLRHRRWLPLFALVGASYVALVGLSRLYLGVHYPSDVLAGWCASLAWTLGLAAMMRRQSTATKPNTPTGGGTT
jgi:membrane-associated phospholipid phosphatase